MKNLTLADIWNAAIPVPEDGIDRRTAASLETAFQRLGNAVNYLYNRVDPLSGTAGEVKDFLKRAGSGVRAWQVRQSAASLWNSLEFRPEGTIGGANWEAGLEMVRGGALLWRGSNVMTSANGGSGSGFNADLLDGFDSSAFLRLATGGSLAGSLFAPQFVSQIAPGNIDFVLQTAAGGTRWGIYKEVTESGGDGGNDLWINRYSNAQALLGTPVKIRRSDGLVALENALSVSGLSTLAGGYSSTSGTLSGALNLDSAPGAIKVAMRTAVGGQRWVIALENAEAGGNIGNDWALLRYDNTNAFLSRPIRVPRNTGIPAFDAGFASPGVPTFDAGGIALQVRASAANNFAGLGIYGDNASLATRQAYIGQPSPGVRDVVILNDVSGAHINLSTSGVGETRANGSRIVTVGMYGAGGGINADLLDGFDSSAFARKSTDFVDGTFTTTVGVSANARLVTSTTLTGAAVGDHVLITPTNNLSVNVAVSAFVSASNTLSLLFDTNFGGVVLPAGSTFNIRAIKRSW